MLIAGLAALAAGCGGGGGDGTELLRETAANLDEIQSGTLRLRLVVDPEGGAGDEPFGFELEGPFALGEPGELPVARIVYTQIANGEEGTATVISTGEQAYVEVDGTAYELSDEDEESLREANAEVQEDAASGNLQIGSWFRDPKSSGGEDVGGDDTDRVTADVDVVNAANSLIALAESIGYEGLAQITGDDARQLDDAVRSASLELLTGSEDRLLRRLKLDADVGFDVIEALRSVLGEAVAAKIEFELEITDPNEPVTVEAPADPRPASELG